MEQFDSKLKDHRAQNAARNMFVYAICNVVIVFGPFLIRTIMARYLGMEMLGLHSVLQTTIGILNVAEMGFGQVMIYFLVDPLSRGNTERVNALLKAMRRVYCFIGLFILAFGTVFLFLLPYFVRTDAIGISELRVCFILFVLSSALNYFLFMENVSLLNALQRIDIYYIIAIVMSLMAYSLQAVALMVFRSYLLFLTVLVIQAVLTGIFKKVITRKMFPEYYPEGEINSSDWRNIKTSVISMIGFQIDEKLLNSIDTLFITAIIGLSSVALYGNYFYVITAVTMFLEVVFNSLLSVIGNAIVTETVESNYFRFECIFWLNSLLAGWASSCMFCMYQSFMKLWMGDNLLGNNMVALFCVYFYVSYMRRSVTVFKNAAGIWKEDRLKPYVSMLADFILDFLLIHFLGLAGAILSSIICVSLIEQPWETGVLFGKYFDKKRVVFYKDHFKYSVLNLLLLGVCLLFSSVLRDSGEILKLGGNALICTVVFFSAYLVIFRKSKILDSWKYTAGVVIKDLTGSKGSSASKG